MKDDETGFYYCHARYYDPKIGKFISADDRIDGLFTSAGQNMYMYCHGNPINFNDPDGHGRKDEMGTVIIFWQKNDKDSNHFQHIALESKKQYSKMGYSDIKVESYETADDIDTVLSNQKENSISRMDVVGHGVISQSGEGVAGTEDVENGRYRTGLYSDQMSCQIDQGGKKVSQLSEKSIKAFKNDAILIFRGCGISAESSINSNYLVDIMGRLRSAGKRNITGYKRAWRGDAGINKSDNASELFYQYKMDPVSGGINVTPMPIGKPIAGFKDKYLGD